MARFRSDPKRRARLVAAAAKRRVERDALRAFLRAKRDAKKRAAQLKKKQGPPQSDVQGHLALLDGDLRAMKQPRGNSRTERREKKRGPLNWNGGCRGKNKTNGKALLRAALRAM